VTIVRFGKRYKNPLLWGRRPPERDQDGDVSFSEVDEVVLKPVAPEERNALLGAPSASIPPAPGAPHAGNIAQHLLTALGRFQRHIAQAREGASPESWVDESMDQLEIAVGIAVKQGWNHAVEALTETAKVLHSYETARRAHECIPFLTESSEALCLMAGELINGEEKSDILPKWEECHRRVLREMRDRKIAMTGDEEKGPEPSAADEKEDSMPPHDVFPDGDRDRRRGPAQPTVSASPFPLDDAVSDNETDASDLAIVGDLAPLNVDGTLGEEPVDISAYPWDDQTNEGGASPDVKTWDIEETPLDATEADAPSRAEAFPETEPEEDTDEDEIEYDAEEETTDEDSVVFVDDDPVPAPVDPEEEEDREEEDEDDLLLEEEVDAVAPEPEEIPEETPAPAASEPLPEIVETLDRLCECLAQFGEAPPSLRPQLLGEIEACLAALQHDAAARIHSGSVEACRTIARLCRVAAEQPGTIDDRFFELAYGFCGIYTEASADPSDPAARHWRDECDALIEELTGKAHEAFRAASAVPVQAELDMTGHAEPETFEVPQEDAAPAASEPPPSPPEQDPGDLLDAARQLMAEGNTADAKLTALVAALTIGQAQVADAHARVTLAERRLRESATAIDQARLSVRDAEQAVESAELHVANTRANIETMQGNIQEIEAQDAALDATIADIEEQIRQLQARRDAEQANKAEVLERLQAEQTLKEQTETERDRLEQEEEAARLRLEDERQRVKDLQRRRTEIEAAMTRAREVLARQMTSFADIQATVEQIRSVEAGSPADSEEFLF